MQCGTCSPACRTSSPSPTHTIGVMPAASALCALALTSSSVSRVVLAPLAVPDHDVGAAELGQHRRRDLAGVGAAVVLGDVLGAVPDLQPVAVDEGLHRADVGVRRHHDHLDAAVVVLLVVQRPGQLLDEDHRFLVVEVQLPVARHQRGAGRGHGRLSPPGRRCRGASLPSRYSRLAPPPVEMWPNASSSKPRVRTAAAESPPPTTDSPSHLGQRLGDRPGAVGERRGLEDAHRAVPEHRPRRRRPPRRTPAPSPGRCRGPSASAGIASAATTCGCGSRSSDGNSVSTTMSVGSTISDAGLLGPPQVVAADVDLVLLEQALADLVALRLEEGEDHPAADQQRVGLAEQVVDHAELVGDLRAAEHDDVGPLGVLGEPLHHLELGGDQAAHGVRQPLRDVVDRRLLAVHDPEAVGDERVGERGQLVGERAALGVVLAGLAGVEPDVLQHGDLAVGEPGHRLAGRRRRRCRSRRRRPGRAARRAARRPGAASSGPPARPSAGRGARSPPPGRRRRPAP